MIYKKIHYEPERDHPNIDFSKYRVDHRSPLEMAEDEMKKSKGKESEKIVEEVKEEKDPPKDYSNEEQQVIDINLDLDKNVYRYYSINKHERYALLKEGYKILKYKTMLSGRIEKYIVKPRFNESILHFFTIYDIQIFLKSRGIKSQVFATKKPDLVFYANGKSYAIEVETGSVLKRSKKQVLEKCKIMKKNYNFGFIVVISRRMVKEYRKIVSAIDMRYLRNKLERILKNSRN